MEISEKARPDRWNKVFEDVSCAPVGRGERWKPGIKKKRGSCRAGLGGGGCCMEHKAMKRVLYM